jgi:hypothetical protein
MTKKIQDIEKKEDGLYIHLKEGSWRVYCAASLADITIAAADEEKIYVVVDHKKENLNILIKRWPELSADARIVIIFVDVPTNRKWLISPYSHSRIASDNLEKGLLALYEGSS